MHLCWNIKRFPDGRQKIRDGHKGTSACADKCIYAYICRQRRCLPRDMYRRLCILFVVCRSLVTGAVVRHRFVKYLPIPVTYEPNFWRIPTALLAEKGDEFIYYFQISFSLSEYQKSYIIEIPSQNLKKRNTYYGKLTVSAVITTSVGRLSACLPVSLSICLSIITFEPLDLKI